MSFIKSNRKNSNGRHPAIAAVPEPIVAPPERVAPKLDEYLDPHVGEGARERVILMVSKDHTYLEPRQRINLSAVNELRLLAQATQDAAIAMTDIACQYEFTIAQQQQQINALTQLVSQLTEKAGIDPSKNPHPAPAMPGEVG